MDSQKGERRIGNRVDETLDHELALFAELVVLAPERNDSQSGFDAHGFCNEIGMKTSAINNVRGFEIAGRSSENRHCANDFRSVHFRVEMNFAASFTNAVGIDSGYVSVIDDAGARCVEGFESDDVRFYLRHLVVVYHS